MDLANIAVVVARYGVLLATLLAQVSPKPAGLTVHVLDAHAERRSNSREGTDHQSDQRSIAQAYHGRDPNVAIEGIADVEG